MKRYYYDANISDFKQEDNSSILGKLADSNVFELTIEQRNAWNEQIIVLKEALPLKTEGHLFFEYTIPRMGKRCDVILLLNNTIVVLEFKAGSSSYHNQDKIQTIDYALDLKNFHKASHDQGIIPILVATNAEKVTQQLIEYSSDKVANCLLTNRSGLSACLQQVITSQPSSEEIDAQQWASSPYQPTPTIIEAAKALYKDHNVKSISRSDASGENLASTAKFIDSVITKPKANKSKSICFITGVPGAGKTLAGLNLATERNQTDKGEHAVFLSGNGPLVAVLQRALAVDRKEQKGGTISEAKRKTSTFIQNIHHFRDDHLDSSSVPVEKVVVFDEAQRAWTAEKASKFMKEKKAISNFNQSEPSFLLNVMDRHEDWCVVVALIGGGQEINDGEAGLPEWLKALKKLESTWTTYYSPSLNTAEYTRGADLTKLLPDNSIKHEALHLSVCIRSFRSEKVSTFINHLIAREPLEAENIISDSLNDFPIRLTRNLETAKKWAREKQRGSERMGLMASAGAKRLVPYGVHMNTDVDPEKWFLSDEEDIRSSNFLEATASQFDIQGLEVDWAVVCWDADLRYEDSSWQHHKFVGSKWQQTKKEDNQLYLRNAYRVLLTRARQGMVIFVPQGSHDDYTRLPEFYDGIYAYLKSCGIPTLDD